MLEDFGIDELAEFLHLTPAQVKKMADRDRIPGRRVGGQWRFQRGEIHHWLEERIGASDEEELAQVKRAFDVQDKKQGELEHSIAISSLLQESAIIIPMQTRTRRSVITKICQHCADIGLIWEPEKMAEAISQRENLHSTALDNGVALLHPRRPMSNIIGEPFLALGKTHQGIPFGGPRGQMTDIFFLIASVDDRGHLRTLARLSRLINSPGFVSDIREVETAEEARSIIVNLEAELFRSKSRIWSSDRSGFAPKSLNLTFVQFMQPRFLITGDYQHPDFAVVLETLESDSIELPMERFWGLTEENKAKLVLVIIAESSREQTSRSFVESIRDALPLARILIIQNDWCTGKKLPHQIFPGVTYRHVSQWHIVAKHIAADSIDSVLFDLPETANEIDRQVFLAERSQAELDGLRIGIVTSCFSDFDGIDQAVRNFGASSIWLQARLQEAELRIIVDCLVINSTINGIDFQSVEHMKSLREFKHVPIVAIANFPRQADLERALKSGVSQIVPQPFLLEQLQFAIKSAVGMSVEQASSVKKRRLIP